MECGAHREIRAGRKVEDDKLGVRAKFSKEPKTEKNRE